MKLDFANAHSEVSRAALLKELSLIPSLKHLTQNIAVSIAAHTTLVSNDKRWWEAGDGMIQGSAEAGLGFTVAIHPDLVTLDLELAEYGGVAHAGQDDVLALGPPEIVFGAIERFSRNVRDRCGLVLQKSKSEVFSLNNT